MIKDITKFFSSRVNLNIIQCILYFIIGYIMGEYLNWKQFGILFFTIFALQFITRTKGVADGMAFRQLMIDNEWEVNKVIQKIKEQADRAKKEDIN